MERNKRGKSVFRRVIGDCMIAAAVLLTIDVEVVMQHKINTAGPADYAIGLGMALENGQPTKDLLYRVETAKEYLEKSLPAPAEISSFGSKLLWEVLQDVNMVIKSF